MDLGNKLNKLLASNTEATLFLDKAFVDEFVRKCTQIMFILLKQKVGIFITFVVLMKSKK